MTVCQVALRWDRPAFPDGIPRAHTYHSPPMHSLYAPAKRFMVSNPDAYLSRRAAIKLIHRHADKVRVFEDLEGYPALMVADKNTRRLVLFADLSDAQIYAELPDAWRREHYQADLFRDAPQQAANDAHHPPSLIRKIWRWFLSQ